MKTHRHCSTYKHSPLPKRCTQFPPGHPYVPRSRTSKNSRDCGDDGISLNGFVHVCFLTRNLYHKIRKNWVKCVTYSDFILSFMSCYCIRIQKAWTTKAIILRPCRRCLKRPNGFYAAKSVSALKKVYKYTLHWFNPWWTEKKKKLLIFWSTLLKINISYLWKRKRIITTTFERDMSVPRVTLKMWNLSPHRLVTVESNHFG